MMCFHRVIIKEKYKMILLDENHKMAGGHHKKMNAFEN